MSKNKMVLAGSLWVALLGGCASECQPTTASAAACPVATNPTLPAVMPRLGAGDALGHQIFTEDRLATRTILNTTTADVAD